VIVRLTPDGAARADAALIDLLNQEQQILSGLPTDEQEQLASMLRVLVVPFDNA